MKILILSLIAYNLQASISTEAARGQDPSLGSFYLKSNRTKFRNPGKVSETRNSVYLESRGEIDYKEDSWAFALGRQVQGGGVIDAFYHADIVGFSGYLNPSNGKGIKTWGFNFGINSEDLDMYFGFHDSEKTNLIPKIGLSLPSMEGTFFAEYFGRFFSVNWYEFTLGWGREYKNFFGDVSYHQINQEKRELSANLGARISILENLYAIGSGKAELFFNPLFTVMAGLQYEIRDFEISASHSLTAFNKNHPNYRDYKLDVSVGYFF